MKTLIYTSLIITTGIVGLACNNETEKPNLLLGVWEEAVKNQDDWDDPQYSGHCEGPDGGFDGTWQFKEDERYRLDFVYGGMVGPTVGYSEGTFSLESDSILILSATEVTDQYVAQEFDTLIVDSLTDTMFVEHNHRERHGAPFPLHPCLRFWKRID